MATNVKKAGTTISKKDLRKQLETKLGEALSGMEQAAEKKFKKLVKKASKLLADGFHHKPKAPKKATPSPKKIATPKKAAVKKTVPAKKQAPKKK